MKRKLYMGVEIYVGHISGTVTEDEVRKLFSVAGTVTSVHLVIEPGTGEYRGCGYVRMSTEDEAREAVGLLNGAMLGDGLIVVKAAPPKSFKKAGPFGGGRGGQGGRTG
jgi:RNA recognition motif-containing protein